MFPFRDGGEGKFRYSRGPIRCAPENLASRRTNDCALQTSIRGVGARVHAPVCILLYCTMSPAPRCGTYSITR